MLKQQIIEYRQQNPEYRVLLGTVIGELDRITKNPTDEQVIQVIKKMIDANNLIGQTQKTIEENFVLSKFLPSQLSFDDIKEIIETEQFESLKECMAYFKGNFPGEYDGKLVNQLFKEKINK